MKSFDRLKSLLSFFFLSFFMLNVLGQHQEVSEKPNIWKGKHKEETDSTSLLFALQNGQGSGHFRYYFSATDNNGNLTDYYANAIGGGLRYESAPFHHFQIGVSGFYVFNIGSSDLSQADTTTNQFNRYEIGLFDIEDPTNKKDIDRLEELYVRYNIGKSYIRYGRQLINTPFINLQDGRMRPTGVEGFWFEINEVKNLNIDGGWIYAFSPRSTVKWFDASQSVGVYSMGVNTSGKRSDYFENIESEGAFLLGANYKAGRSLTISGWNLMFDNVLNAALLQVDMKWKKNDNLTLIAGIQGIREDAINHGGNEDQHKTYIDKNAKSMTCGGRLGASNNHWEFTANYNHIFDQGRYLMPREWGRDPFYTFMPRERNEGLGDVDAFVGKLSYKNSSQKFSASLAGGYFMLPDTRNYQLNKYGMPSYAQINADIRYKFDGQFKGLESQILLVNKINQGDLHDEKKYEFNKVNMSLINVVLNYHF